MAAGDVKLGGAVSRGVCAFEAYNNVATQNIETGRETMAPYDTEEGDDDGAGGTWFNPTTGIATVPKAGWYLFTGSVGVAGIDDAERIRITLVKNGTDWADSLSYSPQASANLVSCVAAVVKCAAGDQFKLDVHNNDAATNPTLAGPEFFRFAGCRIR